MLRLQVPRIMKARVPVCNLCAFRESRQQRYWEDEAYHRNIFALSAY